MNCFEIAEERAQYVAVKNELIQNSIFELSLMEQKALLYLISKIKPNDTPGKEYVFNIDNFCAVCNLDNRGSTYYQYLRQLLIGMKSKTIIIRLDKNRELITSWFADAEMNRAGNSISVTFSPRLTPFLYDLHCFYTQFSYDNILAMRSKYGTRLFWFAQSVASKGHTQTYDIEFFRERMGCIDIYTSFKDFRTYVLAPALDDVNTYSDLYVECKPIKHGRRVAQIELKILPIPSAGIPTERSNNRDRALNA